LQHTLPDLCEDSSEGRSAKIKIASVDLAGNDALWLLEEVIFLIPQVSNTVPLLQQLGAGRQRIIFRKNFKSSGDEVVLGRKVKVLAVSSYLGSA